MAFGLFKRSKKKRNDGNASPSDRNVHNLSATGDMAMGFNPQLIQESFSEIAPQGEIWVKQFYDALFESHPEIKSLFSATNMQLQVQAFLRGLAYIVDNLDSQEKLIPYLNKLGSRHFYYDIRDEYYDALVKALLASLARASGDKWTEELQRHWSGLLALITATMKNGGRAAARQPHAA